MTEVLARLVGSLEYKPGWRFSLRYGHTMSTAAVYEFPPATTGNTSSGGTVIVPDDVPAHLVIDAAVTDSGTGRPIVVSHTLAVPHPRSLAVPADEAGWALWLLAAVLMVERHEACEFFALGGRKPFYPAHGPGANPYAEPQLPGSSECFDSRQAQALDWKP